MIASVFTGVDIGAPRLAGATQTRAGMLEIQAGGSDIYGTRDEFHFVYVRVLGDFQFNVRLCALTMADVYTKAGVMVRASLTSGAENAALIAFGDNQPRNKNNGGIEFQYRAAIDGPTVAIYPPQPLSTPPDFPVTFPHVGLRLSRSGDLITGVIDTGQKEGAKTFISHRQWFPPIVYLGLAVTSHNPDQMVTASFANLDLNANIVSP